MASFPFFNFPYSNYYRYYPGYTNYYQKTNNIENDSEVNTPNDAENNVQANLEANNKKHEKRSSSYNNLGPINFNFDFFTDYENPIIEIFGIKLYLDDLIIISLLFFLYQEGVQDELLFIALILLLLS